MCLDRPLVNAAIALLIGVQPLHAETNLPLDALLSDIQKILVKIRDSTNDSNMPALKEVHLELTTSLEREADGSLKFYVLEVGADTSDKTLQEIQLDLSPPEPSDRSPVSASVAPLAEAIMGAAQAVKLAASRDPPLHLKKLQASIEFVIEKDIKASGGFSILPLSPSLTGKVNTSNKQHVTLIFAK